MTVYVAASCEYTQGCCGVRQICEFSTQELHREYVYGYFRGSGETEQAAYQSLLDAIQAYDYAYDGNDFSCSVLQIWFYKPRDYAGNYDEHYKAEALRQLVAAIPNVVDLGEHHNVNSGNLIQGYQWSVA